MSESYEYPFDPTGTLESNLIQDEYHVISPPEALDYYLIIPFHAPFFREGLKVVHMPSGVELIEHVDYVPSYQFLDASHKTAKQLFGAISILDPQLSGSLKIDYQTIGGQWAIDETKAAELLANVASNPRTTTWDEVVELPDVFPVIDHEHYVDDMVGMSELVDSLNGVAEAIEQGNTEEYNFDNTTFQISYNAGMHPSEGWMKLAEHTYDPASPTFENLRIGYITVGANPFDIEELSLSYTTITFFNSDWNISKRRLAGDVHADFCIADNTADSKIELYIKVPINTSRFTVTVLTDVDGFTFDAFDDTFYENEPTNTIKYSVNIDPNNVYWLAGEISGAIDTAISTIDTSGG